MTKTQPLNPFRAARYLVGLTQVEASKRSRLSQSVLSDLESGDQRHPQWETVGRLAVLYQCSPFDLMPLEFTPKGAPRRLLLGQRGGRS